MSESTRGLVQLLVYGLVCAAALTVPLWVEDAFLLNKIARYLVLGILAVSLSLAWGGAGILSLGQATWFGLGSYAMAMSLKLRTVPVHTGAEGLPDFMVWNNVEQLPWLWVPFQSQTFAILAGILGPALLAAALGWFMFRGRITGVYVAIITLATLVVVNLLVIDQQPYTGGFNGITDLAQLELLGITFDAYSTSVYYLIAIVMSCCLFLTLMVSRSKTGLILQAIRDHESRVRYFGYDVAHYKIFVFALSAAIAGLAGMLYTVVLEFASPTFMGVQLSLGIVIWCAVGGRQSLIGSLLGAVLVVGMQGALSESKLLLDSWTLIMGVIFILVVLFLPNGLAGAAIALGRLGRGGRGAAAGPAARLAPARRMTPAERRA